MHDTKIRLNAELVSAEARFRMETLRLHGRILRLRREKEELKSNAAKLSIENEELLDRMIKVELECCNALHQLKREKERSKLAIEAMMERALEKDKEKESLPIHRNDSKSLSFILLAAALVLVLFLTSRISLRETYTLLIDHDFITTREQRDDVDIEQNILALRMELSRCSKHSKSFSAARGAIPRDDFSASRSPVMVYVLPLPVCPYAMTVTLIPFNRESTEEEKKDSKSSFCVVFGENTLANVDLCSSAKLELVFRYIRVYSDV